MRAKGTSQVRILNVPPYPQRYAIQVIPSSLLRTFFVILRSKDGGVTEEVRRSHGENTTMITIWQEPDHSMLGTYFSGNIITRF